MMNESVDDSAMDSSMMPLCREHSMLQGSPVSSTAFDYDDAEEDC